MESQQISAGLELQHLNHAAPLLAAGAVEQDAFDEIGTCAYTNADRAAALHGEREKPGTAGGKQTGTAKAEQPKTGEVVEAQTEKVVGERPRGNCSLSGRVVSAATGEPVDHARMYLHYSRTHGSIFINVASDGTFVFKDIPQGPFSLQTSHTAGYQDAVA